MTPRDHLTVLHLSDPQFGREHLFGGNGLTGADRDRDSLFSRLHEDLRLLADRDGLRPDLAVVTGDLAEWGLPAEFAQVVDFLRQLAGALDLPRRRVAIVPGNHDISRSACRRYFLAEDEWGRKPVPPYWPKWEHFVRAFGEFYGDEGPGFAPETPWTLFEMAELRVVVAGLNSTMAESHRDEDHHGWVGEAQLHWFAERLRQYRDDGWLVLGAVHHNAVRKAAEDDENLRDADDLDRFLGHGVHGYPDGGPGPLHLLLHGHTHDGRLNRLPSGLLALSTGSAAVAAEARPVEVPNQYQVLTIRRDGVTRHARQYLRDRKRWGGDVRADPRADEWRHTVRVDLPAFAALAEPTAPRAPEVIPAVAEEGPAFDVFLCHNAEDKPAVRDVAKRLQARGVRPWLDESELRPGLPWQLELERRIGDIHAAAVFVGPNGVGPWQSQELMAFLREFAARDCPVIPVLLPGALPPMLPLFLRGMTWVTLQDDTSLDRLVWGITGDRPPAS